MGCNLSKRNKVRPVVTKTEVYYHGHRAVEGPGSLALTRRPSVVAEREGNVEAAPNNTKSLVVHPYNPGAPDTATRISSASAISAQRPDTGLQCASLVSVTSAEDEEGPEGGEEQGSSEFNSPGTVLLLVAQFGQEECAEMGVACETTTSLCSGDSSSTELLQSIISTEAGHPDPKARYSSSGSEAPSPVQVARAQPTLQGPLTPTLEVHVHSTFTGTKF